MTKKMNNQPDSAKKLRKATKLTKKMLITACISGGILLGAGGIGVMATHGGYEKIEAAVQHEKTANKNDIKIDQQAAIDQFNQKYNDKQINEVELENDHGKYVYKVKGFDKTNEYKVKVNAKDGKVISAKSEKLDKNDKQYALDLSQTISRDEASQIAEKAAKKGNSIEWKLEQEKQDQAVWEVKVKDGKTVKEVNINATSKKVLNIDKDH
ncbi:PepSY domain-containing protein [Limosilactobacillus sp. STM2_1]|uniref:PepSY domain-containing protein n=1 Tax=Limosilactobacillus rudii TaxID=2759755 RepID=A0A7W3UKR1_9LACO|nr:PepSY domain-containing protein [Limosilactobacillus rudii]MBB1079225.1 PepSY domain-containing protein [Limosilactobacillus rudii]MBB1097314.1 PepSY domain-containing protein [Limosilactobacillus rudii]MCD7134423.1 PepSY domain-containing protein [Limosilactobacillus rudii]